MALRRLEPTVLVAEQAYEAILEAIVNGDLPAGYRLRIRDLAAELGTSVMPVREAIYRLEQAGLAERAPYKGAVVKGLTAEGLVQVYDVRRPLEVEAVRQGVPLASEEDVAAMRGEFEAMRQAVTDGRVADILDHDENLLSILYSATGNPVFLEVIGSLWQRCRPYKVVGARNTLDSEDTSVLWTYQEGLLGALVARDAQEAARIHDEAIRNAIERIRTGLADFAASAR